MKLRNLVVAYLYNKDSQVPVRKFCPECVVLEENFTTEEISKMIDSGLEIARGIALDSLIRVKAIDKVKAPSVNGGICSYAIKEIRSVLREFSEDNIDELIELNTLLYSGAPFTCYTITGIAQVIFKLFAVENFDKWPKFNGNHSFPVPAPSGVTSSEVDAFYRLSRWEGEYGDLRLELLNFLIGELK
ncbi:hypothetical protein KNT64_gp192 [Pseudomonas phage PspYZU05]|uniref:Uncharacterized protein n=1 Tax=Pseudomonas phage PspYZU05 TaxID=1983556 RepID=A0A2U7NJM3_9CAUD|nr:hypothetical protein KNT64_gp192 [Pseudomonas phage PspYZU05]ASD52144.1 hypothetical protein PspYZU05_192 [Pseudomonas phage PspYZU05]